ncbi:MAG: thiamine-monophosphate kinase [Planctomycetes bacterium]|nr:thiamine-monophosphate kinase [Planctomycetota bacterium]
MDEFAFIDWIRGQGAFDPQRVPVGPGDDCAVVRVGGQLLLVTTDQCADGVHFILDDCGPDAAGYKVMARSLSDIAAMGGRPLGAVATVSAPKGMSESQLQALYRGLRRAGDAFDCPLVGGDVSAWSHPLLLTTTLWGAPAAAPLLRRGARPGEAICVTGTLGGSLASGKHLTFTPRVAAGCLLAERYPVSAMIDISDGLAADLRHLCRASGVGAELRRDAIPLSAAARATADPLAAALGDGEDYELLFTLPAEAAEALVAAQPLDVPVARIGTATAAGDVALIDPAGRRTPLAHAGWRHST